MNNKKIMIVSWEQFGYHTDNFNHCKYLKNDFDLSVLCFDEKLDKIELEDVNVIYSPSTPNKIIRRLIFIFKLIYDIIKFNPDLIFMRYFSMCHLIKYIFPKKKIVLDIRTACVDKDKNKRAVYDEKLSMSCKKFDYITIISEKLAEKLDIESHKLYILPLGANPLVCVDDKKIRLKEKLHLLYIGSFDGRNLEETISGFNKFCDKYKPNNAKYTIVGYAKDKSIEQKIISEIKKSKFNNIEYVGRVPNNMLKDYLQESTVGVSYVPITEYFQYQPPTKTFEYIMNGLYCIATETYEHNKIINKTNGIKIQDNEQSFINSLKIIYENDIVVDQKLIQSTVIDYKWQNIVNNLEFYFMKIMQQ